MLDVENVRMILQSEVNKREEAKTKCEKYSSPKNKYLEEVYERLYYRYSIRFDGMCDMLYYLGYHVYCNDDNKVLVEKLELC